MGEGKATAGLCHRGLGSEPATLPLPPPPYHPPLKLQATTAWVPLAAKPALQPALPGRTLGGC